MNLNEQLLGVDNRIKQFQKSANEADQVVLTLGCSDSRVRLPENLVILHDKNGKEISVLFIMLPTIGGGVPSRSRLYRTVSDIISWGVKSEKIRILVTQHGDTLEIQERIGRYGLSQEPKQLLSCGLRKFFAQYANELSYIRTVLAAWSDRYKQESNDRNKVLDIVPLELLSESCPEAYQEISKLSKKTGRVPRRLLIRAAYRNATFDIEENGEAVRSKIAEYLREEEFREIFSSCTVGLADYDHNLKVLHFAHPYTSLNWNERVVEFKDIAQRTVPYQDPEFVTVTFSRNLLPIPDTVLYPESTYLNDKNHRLQIDATFRSAISTPKPEALLCGIAEASYAVLHNLGGHDSNFKRLSEVAIICDSDNYFEIAQEITKHPEFISDFLPFMQEFGLERMKVYRTA